MKEDDFKRLQQGLSLALDQLLILKYHSPDTLRYQDALYLIESTLWSCLKDAEKLIPEDKLIALQHLMYTKTVEAFIKVIFQLNDLSKECKEYLHINSAENVVDGT